MADSKFNIKQLSLQQIILAFTWPAAWYSLIIYGFGRFFIPDEGTIPTYFVLSVIAFGSGAELLAGLILLRKEGYELTITSLKERIRFSWPKGFKVWLIAAGVFILSFGLSLFAGPVNKLLARVPGFVPPQWWPPASNPLISVNSASDVFPDISLSGNYLFLILYFLIGLIGNIFGEELYYRGYLLPKMRGVFGKYDWIANAILFTLKHAYQRWLYPGILIGGLCFGFTAGVLGSLPLTMVYHWVGNFLFPLLFLSKEVFGF